MLDDCEKSAPLESYVDDYSLEKVAFLVWIEEAQDPRPAAIPELVSESWFRAGDEAASRPDSFFAARSPGWWGQEERGRKVSKSQDGSNYPIRESLERACRYSRL